MNKKQKPKDLLTRDGNIAILFVNTASAKRQSLESYTGLISWALEAGLLTELESDRLTAAANASPATAEAVFRDAEKLRQHLETIFRHGARKRAAPEDDIQAINNRLVALYNRRSLSFAHGTYRCVLENRGELESVLWPILLATDKLLTGKGYQKLVECADEECRLLLLSQRERRWCSRRCSHRNASRRHYRAVQKPRKEEIKRRSARLAPTV